MRWAWFAAKAESGMARLGDAMDGLDAPEAAERITQIHDDSQRADAAWNGIFNDDDAARVAQDTEEFAKRAGFDGKEAARGSARALVDGARSQGMSVLRTRALAAMMFSDPKAARMFSGPPSEAALSAMRGYLSFASEITSWGGSGMMDRQRMLFCLRSVGMRMACLAAAPSGEDAAEALETVDVCRRFWTSCVTAEGHMVENGLPPIPAGVVLSMVQTAKSARDLSDSIDDKALAERANDLAARLSARDAGLSGADVERIVANLPRMAFLFARNTPMSQGH